MPLFRKLMQVRFSALPLRNFRRHQRQSRIRVPPTFDVFSTRISDPHQSRLACRLLVSVGSSTAYVAPGG